MLMAQVKICNVKSSSRRSAKEGIHLVACPTSTTEQRPRLTQIFDERIFPVLTPLSVDPAHPFPYISSLSLYLAILVRTRSPAADASRD